MNTDKQRNYCPLSYPVNSKNLGPNVSPGGTVRKGTRFPSAVLVAIELPYQLSLTPGYARQKKIRNEPTASAASSPADRM